MLLLIHFDVIEYKYRQKKRYIEIFITVGEILILLPLILSFKAALNATPSLDANDCQTHILGGFGHAEENEPQYALGGG